MLVMSKQASVRWYIFGQILFVNEHMDMLGFARCCDGFTCQTKDNHAINAVTSAATSR